MSTPSYPFEVTDPFELPKEFAVARSGDPVTRVRIAATGDEVWLVTRYDDIRDVLADQRFSRNLDRDDVARLIPGVRQPSSPFADPPAHGRWRRLVSRAFTVRRIEEMRDDVQDIVDRLLDDVTAREQPV